MNAVVTPRKAARMIAKKAVRGAIAVGAVIENAADPDQDLALRKSHLLRRFER